jgi:short-subunit dehydrogenase
VTTTYAVSTTHRQPGLAGQTVVVIGGSAGIGLETARLARTEGANVVLTGRNPDRLDAAASELGALRSARISTSRSTPTPSTTR